MGLVYLVRNAIYPNTFRTWARQPGNHYVRGIGLRFLEGSCGMIAGEGGNHKEKEKKFNSEKS